MSKVLSTIPRAKIARIENYMNTRGLTLPQAVAERGADYGFGGQFFTGNFKCIPVVKGDGVMHTAYPYTMFGFGWDEGGDIVCHADAWGFSNYCSGVQLITPYGPEQTVQCEPDVRGVRGRHVWGLSADAVTHLVTTDGTDAMSEYQARDWAVAQGFDAAVMMDGGTKTQCVTPHGSIYSPIVVPHYILIYLKKEEGEPVDGLNITQRLMTKNRCYTNPVAVKLKAAMLHSTSTPGATAANIAANWDKPEATASVHFVVDDKTILQTLPISYCAWHCGSGTKGSGNDTHVSVELCEPLENQVLGANWIPLNRAMTAAVASAPRVRYAITLVQTELVARGYDPKGIDGSYGPGCEAAVKAFQRDNGLAVDGSVGPMTLAKLQNRAGSCLIYPVAAVKPYFDKVYATAVVLFAWICAERGFGADKIICHSEGYKLGIASNHADVMHWFPQYGKDMDMFRADVAAAMYSIAPDPFIVAVDKLAAAGVITDAGYWKAGTYSAENVKALLIKMAAAI